METKKIEAKNLEKQYVLKEKTGLFRSKNKKIVQAVKGVSLEIPKGKIVGVLGINGSRKNNYNSYACIDHRTNSRRNYDEWN